MEAEITVADYHRLPRLRAESQSIKLRLLGLINKLDECLTDKPLDKDILLNKLKELITFEILYCRMATGNLNKISTWQKRLLAH